MLTSWPRRRKSGIKSLVLKIIWGKGSNSEKFLLSSSTRLRKKGKFLVLPSTMVKNYQGHFLDLVLAWGPFKNLWEMEDAFTWLSGNFFPSSLKYRMKLSRKKWKGFLWASTGATQAAHPTTTVQKLDVPGPDEKFCLSWLCAFTKFSSGGAIFPVHLIVEHL